MGLEPTPPLKGQESESCASAIPPLPQSYLTYLLYNIVFIQSTKILKVININLQNTKSVCDCPADASDEPQSIHYEETETISGCFQKANFRL